MKLAAVLLLSSTILCGQAISPHLLKGVRSCEKRHWPAADPTCHGYALAMAHEYYVDHPELFDPKPEPTIFWGPLTANVVATPAIPTANLGSSTPEIHCGKYEHVEHHPGYCSSQCDMKSSTCTAVAVCTPDAPDTCADDFHSLTEKEWQGLMDRLAELEKKR